ncbi:type II toxin-antitoxin system PemK/MazF family toxin [Nonomuraea indica]|uniref:mRNA interferase n=1 Tax=Nonomuraea indica TaxID=1581193 RepID=A0ABW8A083_9ACTN|nr:type II toxin-antitoxin system PemK/MazF family toxin [Nonomuraea indica]
MKATRGDIWFADLGDPTGREQGFPRPVLVLSNDRLNRSKLGLVLAIPLTTRERGYLTHIRVSANGTGLAKTSWAMVEQIRALSPERFEFYVGHAPDETVDEAIGVLRQMI